MEHVGLQEHSCAVQGCRAVRCELGWSRLQAGPGLQHWGGGRGGKEGLESAEQLCSGDFISGEFLQGLH